MEDIDISIYQFGIVVAKASELAYSIKRDNKYEIVGTIIFSAIGDNFDTKRPFHCRLISENETMCLIDVSIAGDIATDVSYDIKAKDIMPWSVIRA